MDCIYRLGLGIYYGCSYWYLPVWYDTLMLRTAGLFSFPSLLTLDHPSVLCERFRSASFPVLLLLPLLGLRIVYFTLPLAHSAIIPAELY